MRGRTDWGAAPRRDSPLRDEAPTALVVHHTAGRRPLTEDKLHATLRAIQQNHQFERSWSDIAYNYGVAPWGDLYKLRGDLYRNGANGTPPPNRNRNTISVVLFGDMSRDTITENEKRAIVTLARQWKLTRPQIVPHSAINATECPGDSVRTWLAEAGPDEPDGDLRTRIAGPLARLRFALADLEAEL